MGEGTKGTNPAPVLQNYSDSTLLGDFAKTGAGFVPFVPVFFSFTFLF